MRIPPNRCYTVLLVEALNLDNFIIEGDEHPPFFHCLAFCVFNRGKNSLRRCRNAPRVACVVFLECDSVPHFFLFLLFFVRLFAVGIGFLDVIRVNRIPVVIGCFCPRCPCQSWSASLSCLATPLLYHRPPRLSSLFWKVFSIRENCTNYLPWKESSLCKVHKSGHPELSRGCFIRARFQYMRRLSRAVQQRHPRPLFDFVKCLTIWCGVLHILILNPKTYFIKCVYIIIYFSFFFSSLWWFA